MSQEKYQQLLFEVSPYLRQRLSSSYRPAADEPVNYHLIHIDTEGGDPISVETFFAEDELRIRVKEILANAGYEDQLFVFYGKRVQLAAGPLPHIIVPGVGMLPVYDEQQELRVLADGFILNGWPEVAAEHEMAEEDLYEYQDYFTASDDSGEVVDEEPDN